MSAAVGADIESICRKCGDVWHVVVAKNEGKIAKVLCKECGLQHRYRPPKSEKAASKKKTTTRKKRASSAKSKQEPVLRIDQPMVEADTSKPVREYKFSETFAPGERIEHPKFGHGVVEITAEPGKMQVFFPEGRRILALAKPKSTLERPKPFNHEGTPDRKN